MTAMKATPFFLGACAFASMAGALSGAATNTTPIQNGGIGMDMLPERAFAFDPRATAENNPALPDHYPIVTPAGRFDVGELATRGLYAQQRFGWREADYIPPPPEPAFEYDVVEHTEVSPPAIDAQPLAPPRQPLDLSPSSQTGEARMIDVATELSEGN